MSVDQPALPAGRGIALASDFQVYGSGSVRPHRVRFDPADPGFLSRRSDGIAAVRVLAPADVAEVMLVARVDDRPRR